MNHPVRLIFIGFVLVVMGFILPLLMVVGVIPSTYFLNITSYVASFVGLLLGVIGGASYVRMNKK